MWPLFQLRLFYPPVTLKVSTDAQGGWHVCQPRGQHCTRSLRSPVIWGGASPGNTCLAGSRQPHLARSLCPSQSCRNRSRRWRSARLRQRRVWWAALPAFSRRRVSETLKFLQGNISEGQPSEPTLLPISCIGCTMLNALPDTDYIIKCKHIIQCH